MSRTTLLLILLLLPSSSSSIAAGLYSRNLACEQFVSPRSVEICTALEGALAWRWTGHGIISPGYRMDIKRVRDLYCSLPVTGADTATLVEIALASVNAAPSQTRLYNGALSLLFIAGDKALSRFPKLDDSADESRQIAARYLQEQIRLTIAESSTSIFNPSHPDYILRHGCR